MSFIVRRERKGSFLLLALFSLALYLVSLQPVYADNSQYVQDELIIKYKSGYDITDIASKHAGVLEQNNRKLRLGKLKLRKDENIISKKKELQSDPQVEYVEFNHYYSVEHTPNDPYIDQQWAIQKIKAGQAWDITKGENTVTVAIIDTGVDADHPDLADNLVSGYNTINNSTNTNDDHGHGTHVAGISAGIIDNGVGISGVAGDCKIMPVKVLGSSGSGTLLDVSEGIIWAADNGAKVINLSLGSCSYSQTLQDAITYAHNAGAVVIAAAGNSNSKASFYPAANENVIAVSATTENNEKASFSNYGTYIDIAAPGTSIYSTTYNGQYGYMQGTSMAAPYVSGVAALVLSYKPSLSPDSVEQILKYSAYDLGATGKDIYFGYGLVDAYAALSESSDSSPISLTLIGDSPDPFYPKGKNTNKITYSIGESGFVTIKIYDSNDSLVKTLLNRSAKPSGEQYSKWDGKDDSGLLVSSGTYIYTVEVVDVAGNTSDSLSGTITVDRTNPAINDVTLSAGMFSPSGENTITISYNASENCKITAVICSSSGSTIKTLSKNAAVSAGQASISWDGKNSRGSIVSDGNYTIKINAIDYVKLKAVQQTKTITVETGNPVISSVSDGPDPLLAGIKKSTIKYTLSEDSTVSLKLYDEDSNLVKTLVNGAVSVGKKSITWDGRSDAGAIVPDGVYTYKIDAVDAQDNAATQQVGTITVDTTNPTISDVEVSENTFTPTGSNTVSISYNLSENANVYIYIYNSNNSLIGTLCKNVGKLSGNNSILWDGKNSRKTLVPQGIYRCLITATDNVKLKNQVSVYLMVNRL